VRNIRENRANIKGFTVLELAIVLGIVSLLIGASISIGATRINAARISTTNERISLVMKSLQHYYDLYGHLPCPADPQANETNATYGEGRGSGADGADNCDTTNTIDIDPSGADLVLGMVPFEELGLEPQAVVDGWDHRFTYVVDEDFTNQTKWADTAAGSIDILTNAVNFPAANAIIVVYSHGENGYGAYSSKGGTRDTTTGGSDEEENSHTAHPSPPAYDNEFVHEMLGKDFDDVLVYKTKWQF